MTPITLPLHDPSQWPLRMKRDEVAHVLRRSRAWLEQRIARGEFPRWDGDWMWDRDTVAWYAKGGIKKFDEAAARTARAGVPAAAVVGDVRRRFLKSHRATPTTPAVLQRVR